MSIELKRGAHVFDFSTIGWAFYLNIAHRYGWKGEGTKAPRVWPQDHGQWDHSYDSNCGQIMTGSDAMELAHALQRYLLDPHRSLVTRELVDAFQSEVGLQVEVPADEGEFLTSAIQFLQGGELEIW